MSICICEQCDSLIDSDKDPDCFIERGKSRNISWEIKCKFCRDVDGDDELRWNVEALGHE